MRRSATNRADRLRSGSESGYAVLFALFLVASLLIFAAAATPNVLSQGRREIEREDIWRGNQYVRAVRLFYQKNGRFPQDLDELAKPNAANVHFLRKRYADLLNKEENGKWRLIYVTPAGQLIGSVHYRTLQEMAVATAIGGQFPSGAAAMAAQLFGQPGASAAGARPGANQQATAGQQSGTQTGQNNAQNPSQQGTQSGFGTQGQQQGQGQSQGLSAQLGTFGSSSQPVPVGSLQPVDGPVFGGSVIGVASKVKKDSLIVYQGGKTYFDWEFIYNPLLNAAAGQGQIGVPGTAQPGANQNNPNNPNPTQPGAIPGLGAMPGTNNPNSAPNVPLQAPQQ